MIKPLLMTLVLIAASTAAATGQRLPLRQWNDNMPRHSFSLGMGPSWMAGKKNVAGKENLDIEKDAVAGFSVALRYDWSYFRGYDVSMGTGLTSMFIYNSRSFRDRSEFASGGRIYENFGYVGANAVNTKMWFGKRFIGDVCIHMGYLWGTSTMKKEGTGGKTRLNQNGFAGGVSIGVDCLITAWLGAGIHVSVLAATPHSDGYAGNFTAFNARIGAVYCF